MHKKVIIILLLNIHTHAFSQILLSAEKNWFANCNCTEITMGNEFKKITYIKDTLSKIITVQYEVFDKTIDTLFYDDNDNITEIKTYAMGENFSRLLWHKYYSYSIKGQLLTVNDELYVLTYQYDDKNRPISYTRKHQNEEEVIRIKYTNDTTALLEYYDNGKLIANGKRILNKRYQIVSEILKNPSKGTEARYVFKYDKKGNLSYMQKTKVINDEVRFFGCPHYEYLADGTRKIEYDYDNSGRMISQTFYRGINLEKGGTLQYIYK